MGMVLTAGAIIQCTHKGTCKLTQGNSKLAIGGNAVITSSMETGISFAPGSPNVISPCPWTGVGARPPPSPCVATGPALPSGVAVKLIVGGMGALLDSATGQAMNPNDPSAQWSVASSGQTILQAI